MTSIRFLKLTDWAVPPVKETVEMESHSIPDTRWLVKERVKGACYPYRMGKEFGWTIYSPIDVDICPVEEVQIKGSYEDVEQVGRMMEIDFWMQRGNSYIGIKPAGWFQIHQVKVGDTWQGLFLPNGEGTFEWRLGWGIEIPEDHVLLIQPIEGEQNFIIHPGLLFAKSLRSFQEGLGFGVAFEPIRKHKIRKGDALAKVFVFHKSALELQSEIIERIESR